MLALRFLNGYLDGDRYFRIDRPQHSPRTRALSASLFLALGAAEGDLQYFLR